MSTQILLFQPKIGDAQSLAQQIEQAGDYHVTQVCTVRETAAQLATYTYDLALVPVGRDDSLVYTLRLLQPNLPLYLWTTPLTSEVPPRQREIAAGVLPTDQVAAALPRLLDNRHTADAPPKLDKEHLTLVILHALMERSLQLVLITHGQEMVGYHQIDDEQQLAAAAERVRQTWREGAQTTQITFLQNTHASPANLLLITRALGEGYLLTLGAHLKTPLPYLQQMSQQIVGQIYTPLQKATSNTYWAVTWQPRRPLNQSTLAVLDHVLQKVAMAYQCTIYHAELEPMRVQLTIQAPLGRDSQWIAHIFKDQSAKLLAKLLGLKLPIWKSDHFIRPTHHPTGMARFSAQHL